jgi:hypothetical protein
LIGRRSLATTGLTDRQRAAQARVRGLIWDFYASLKAYRATLARIPAPSVPMMMRH